MQSESGFRTLSRVRRVSIFFHSLSISSHHIFPLYLYISNGRNSVRMCTEEDTDTLLEWREILVLISDSDPERESERDVWDVDDSALEP